MYVVTVARKPLSEPTLVANALEHATGGLAVGAVVLPLGREWRKLSTHQKGEHSSYAKRPAERSVEDSGRKTPQNRPEFVGGDRQGRWPTNLVLVHLAGCRCCQVEGAQLWECASGCAVRALDRYDPEYRVSRYFKQAGLE
jgi:hypothetical protein